MNAAWLALAVFVFFGIALRVYARFLETKVFFLRAENATPSHTHRDDIDFCPAKPSVLFGHHFASICGLGPIIGPAIAAIWGWLPAALWIVCGVVFIGAVHDFGSLVLSMRYSGRSIGDLTKELISTRARVYFLILIFFMIALAMGLFASIIATLFQPEYYPQAVLPAFALIAISVFIGKVTRSNRLSLTQATLIGFLLMLGTLALGILWPVAGIGHTAWVLLLLVYAFIASALPVWVLLQPRDYLNSLLLYLGIGLMYLGIFILRPEIVAPAINTQATDLPPLFPFLFITIACGAVSGFHSLVCSGTTSKQIASEAHARTIGYGGMLAESLMAIAVLLACTAGVAGTAAWHAHYSSWGAAQGLGPSLSVFIDGAALFISQCGLSPALSVTLISVVVVGFAMTTLDSATRLLRYNIEEFGRAARVPALQNRYTASGIAILAIGYFALLDAGKTLWQLFGTTNQLLAALALLAITVYLAQRKRRTFFYVIPMFFMFATTFSAMVLKLKDFWRANEYSLLGVTVVIMLLTAGLITEACLRLFKTKA